MDPERHWFSFRRICYATRESVAAQGMYETLHADAPFHDGTYRSWAKERSTRHPYHFNDGVSFGAADTDLTPWDEFTTKRNASPVRPESPGGDPVGSAARSDERRSDEDDGPEDE